MLIQFRLLFGFSVKRWPFNTEQERQILDFTARGGKGLHVCAYVCIRELGAAQPGSIELIRSRVGPEWIQLMSYHVISRTHNTLRLMYADAWVRHHDI